VRIATCNINNVNTRLPNLLGWLAETKPDVVCLQELKADDRAFPIAEIEAAGYGAAWRGQRTWNGVAILAKDAVPIVTRNALPGDPNDNHASYLEGAVNGVPSPRSISRTAIQTLAPSSTTSWPGWNG
jgi:exodeoxyribonuclease-3